MLVLVIRVVRIAVEPQAGAHVILTFEKIADSIMIVLSIGGGLICRVSHTSCTLAGIYHTVTLVTLV